MRLLVLIPRVVQNYIKQFPEVQRNAYKYFNYDNRVVDERVDCYRTTMPYRGADDFTNDDYGRLISYAKTIVNPILARYSMHVACEDALHTAIRSYENGIFDGKINAGRYMVLLKAMNVPEIVGAPVMAEKKKEKKVVVKPHVLKQLGLTHKDVPLRQRVQRRIRDDKDVPVIVREKGKHVVVKK